MKLVPACLPGQKKENGANQDEITISESGYTFLGGCNDSRMASLIFTVKQHGSMIPLTQCQIRELVFCTCVLCAPFSTVTGQNPITEPNWIRRWLDLIHSRADLRTSLCFVRIYPYTLVFLR
jgi:hypothetical protein